MTTDAFDSLGALLSGLVGPGGAAIADRLEVAYDQGVIADIIKVLDEAQTSLEKSENIRETTAGAYGASPAAQALANHASLARQKVIEVIGDMRAGLMGYQDIVTTFHAETETAEDTSSADLGTLNAAISCVAQPTVSAPSQCTLPTPGGEH